MATALISSGAGSVDAAARARAEYRSGWSLPAYYYLSAERYDRDIERLGEIMWFMAGHASQIPNPGDFKRLTIADESIVVVRDRSGAINAFYNVCRHRGSHLCLEDEGNIKALVCPYHAWTYKLDGTLMRPRSMPRDFDPAQFGLKRCHIGVVDGLMFVCLAKGTPPDFEAFVARIRPFLAPYALGRSKAVAEEHVMSATNWKLPVENFQECYHCPNAHKDLSRILTLFQPEVEPVDDKGETWSARMKRTDRALEPVFDGPESQHLQMAFQQEIGKGHVSATMSGRACSRLMGDIKEWSGGWTVINFNPFAHLVMFDDYVQMIFYTPRDRLSAEATMIWLVRDDAVENVDYNPADLTELLSLTMTEDKRITDDNQKGISSAAYEPCPLSIEEERVAAFHGWYVNQVVDAL